MLTAAVVNILAMSTGTFAEVSPVDPVGIMRVNAEAKEAGAGNACTAAWVFKGSKIVEIRVLRAESIRMVLPQNPTELGLDFLRRAVPASLLSFAVATVWSLQQRPRVRPGIYLSRHSPNSLCA